MAEETIEVDTRGHITLPLGGHEWVLRPSHEAIQAVEVTLRKSHEQLAQAAIQHDLTYREMGVICAEFMKAHAKANPSDPMKTSYLGAKPEKLEQMIYEAGKVKAGVRLSVILTAALNGGYTASGEWKAVGTTEEETPAAE